MEKHGKRFEGNDYGLALIRVLIAVVFIFHGSQKLFGTFGGPGIEGFAGFLGSLNIPFPTFSAYMAGATEFFGGLALLTGVGVRIISLPLTITMLVAAFTASTGFDMQKGGMEYPLTLAFVVAGLGLTGPGKLNLWSLWKVVSTTKTKAPVAGINQSA